MTDKLQLVGFATQGLLLAGLVGLGLSVHELSGEAERLQGEAEELRSAVASAPALAAASSVALATPTPLVVTSQEDRSGAGSAEALREIARRLEQFESRIASLSEEVAGLDRRAGGNQALPQVAGTTEEVSPEELRARSDLAGRYASEGGASEWGEASRNAIERAYLAEQATNPFFAEYAGNVSADCRESVCRLSLPIDGSRMSELSAEEKAGVIDQARRELVGLAGSMQGGGLVRFSVSVQSGIPTVQAFVERSADTASAPPPKGVIGVADSSGRAVRGK